MKRTQLKDALRNIWKQKVSWFAVVIIAMLAVMAYLGINFASHGISQHGNAFYDETHFRDAEIISTLLVTPDDIDAIRAVEGVADVEGVYQTSGKIENDGLRESVDVVSLTERISTPQLLEGRLPETDGECVVEPSIMDDLGLSIGDTIRVTDAQGVKAEYLLENEFIITGVVNHPDHAAWKLQVPGNRDVIVLPESFDREELDSCFMKAVILIEGTAGMDRFGDEYKSTVAAVTERLEALSPERRAIRNEEIRTQYQAEIDASRAELDDGRAELDKSRAELDDGWRTFADGEQELADGKTQLDDAKAQLDDAEAELTDGRSRLDDGQTQLDASYAQLLAAWNELNARETQLAEAEQALADSRTELDSAKARLDEGKLLLDAGEAELAGAEAELSAAREELTSGYEQLEDAKLTIRSALYSALSGVIGEYADWFSWSESAYGVDVDSYASTATLLSITDGITIDLDRSMSDNIFSLIASLGIPEEDLRAAFEAATGIYLELTDGTSLLDAVVSYAAEQYAEYDSRYETLASAARSWNAGHGEYLDSLARYEAGLAELAEKSAEYYDGLEEYRDGRARYEAGLEEYDAGRAALDEAWEQYGASLAQYDAGRAALSESRSTYQDGLAAYEAGLEEYNDRAAAYEDGVAELESGRSALEDGEEQYAAGLAEYEDGQAQLADGQAQLDALDECRWVILDVEGNASYLSIRNSVKNTADMGMTFALVFVLVGALVIYATVGRIVDEQRRLVGATKALGLYNREIFAKYLGFGVTGTVLGMLLGTAGGYFGIQRILLFVYGRYYVFGAGKNAFLGGMTAVVFAAGAALSVLAVWIACSTLMRSTATSLMQEKAPEIRHKEGAGERRKGSLYTRLILLNMRSDMKRVTVTVVSVAGCCALLVAGFTMRQSVMKALNGQFDEVTRYDMQIRFDPNVSEEAQSELEALLTDAGTDWTLIHTATLTFSVDGRLLIANLLCGDLSELDRFYARLDPQKDEALPQAGEGIWVRQRVAEMNGVSAGDTITFYDGGMKPHEIPVAGVFRIYAGQEMILAADQYEAFFGEEPENNAFFLYLNGADAQSLKEAAQKIDGVEAITDITETRAMYQSFASVLNLIAIMFVCIAGMMAYFILLNLVNMYINQKKRELTIMRVNGFTIREVNNYVLRETVVSTALGIVLGLAAGSVLGYRVIRLLESASVRFMRDIQWEAWLYAALITVVFAAAINIAALRKVKYLKLTDVA